MARFVMYGLSNCTDPTREEEFVRWYTQVRQPDVFKTACIKRLRLGVLEDLPVFKGQPRYLALYELETEDIVRDSTELARYVKELNEEGRGTDRWRGTDLFALVQGGIYREINFLSK